MGHPLSLNIVKKILREHNIRKWRAKKRIPLSKVIARERLRSVRGWKKEDFNLTEVRGSKDHDILNPATYTRKVIYSNEYSVQNSTSDPTLWVFRLPSQKFNPSYVNLTNHVKADIYLMVWGAIWENGRSELIIMERDPTSKRKGYTSQSYISALREGLLPIYDGTRFFQQDNSSIHTSAASMEWMMEQGIEIMD